MEISTNNALTAVSYGAVGCVGAMAAANAVLVGAGAGAKVGAYVADYFKNESVAQNLRIKGDQLFSLAGKYAATELKVAAALVAVGGSAALAQYSIDNEVPGATIEVPVKEDVVNEVPVKEDAGNANDVCVKGTGMSLREEEAKAEGLAKIKVIQPEEEIFSQLIPDGNELMRKAKDSVIGVSIFTIALFIANTVKDVKNSNFFVPFI